MKTFTRAGISTNKGKTQFRFTNDLNREKVLDKNGHTDIQFWELGEAMTKEQAIEFLVAKGLTEDKPAAKQKAPAAKQTAPTRKDDEAVLAKLNKGEVAYDEESDSFLKILADKRQAFPSHTDEQIREIAHFQANCNQKHFGELEPNF
jgi:hypothetical protein